MKPKINNSRTRKFTNTWKLNNTLLNNKCISQEKKKDLNNRTKLSIKIQIL